MPREIPGQLATGDRFTIERNRNIEDPEQRWSVWKRESNRLLRKHRRPEQVIELLKLLATNSLAK